MADNLRERGQQDRSRIHLEQEHEIRYWTKKFGCSEEELREVVKKVGSSVDAVQRAVKQ